MKNSLCLLLLACLVLANCKKEAAPPCATFDKDINSILENSCSYAGCHSGATAGAWVPASAKDYTNYAGLKPALDNGKFKDRVLVKADMPNPVYTPDGHPKTLSQAEKDLIECWLSAGYPEK